MSTLNRSYFILGFVSLTLLGSGCQKAASSGVRAKKGVVSAERNQDDAKIEKLLKAGKTAATCDQGIIQKNTALKTEIEMTMTEIQNLKKTAPQVPTNKADGNLAIVKQDQSESDEASDETTPSSAISPQADKSLLAHSSQIKALARALIFEFINKDVASCGKDKDLIGVEATQKTANEAYVAIATARGQETSDSTAARSDQSNKDQASSSESLLGQKLKAKKELVEVLDEQNQANSLFVTQGQKGSVQENYQIALNDSKNGVCLLEKAPSQKLKEDSVITVLKTEVVTSETLTDGADKQVAQKTNLNLVVQLGSGDQLLTFNCRLKNDLKKQSAVSQFYEIFGDLLVKQTAVLETASETKKD